MKGDQVQQLVGQKRPFLRHAAAERGAGQLRVGQVVGLDALAIQLSIAHDAADADATKVHPVVALHPADEARFSRLPFEAPIGPRHFQRRVGGFGT